MIELFLRRIAGFVLVLFVLSLIIFVLARVVPGDPARIALGPRATQEQVDAMRISMGLDEPLIGQYFTYIGKVLHGDLGESLLSHKPVRDDLATFLPATLELVLATVILVFAVSIPLGVLTARYRNGWIDHLGRFFSLVGVTMPGFLFAVLLQLFVARFVPGWPILGRMDYNLAPPTGPTGLYLIDSIVHGRPDVFLAALKYLTLPTLALALASIGQITRITRSAMIENQRKDHVLTLRSFGVPTRVIVFRYLLKLSSIAPLTILGLEFASLIGNAFVVEMVFSWGGFASYGLSAIMQKDLNAVMAVVLVSGCFFVVANLVIDVILTLLDPRLRLREAR
ncbi:ABC transporter permease [Kaistia dalseonensis]|uniref:Peptide/nickel transport system permease protein n=1 Tax=Kaistia dalseonensis TaxID=410840 RepID=A0ABU0H0P3_9HYPH|nr:ABC transporter permease [Kaistia dalseonensis]MCX5493318.1 ABC transporter permease [Kaistia dalseonensis]MDQ0435875.1 peptide/nickel transport system permease protein [Kaistia dalseonensis]